jgi:hypothetical protein
MDFPARRVRAANSRLRHLFECLESRRLMSGDPVGDVITPISTGRTAPPVRATLPLNSPKAAPIRRFAPSKATVLPLEPTEPTGLVGDLNGDYRVDSSDFDMFFANFGGSGRANGDVNRDGTIDFDDFQLIERNFGVSITPPPPPPPTPDNYAYIGTNLDGISDWGTIGAFANLARTFRPWGTIELPYTPDPDLPLTPDGYPLADAGTVTYAYSYPDGVYKVSWEGTGDLSFIGIGAEFAITSNAGNAWTGDLALDHDGGDLLTMYVRNIDPANPLRNLKIMSPDVDYSISGTFRPVFLQKLAPFNGPLRMMDWMQTNNNPAVEWVDRVEPSNFTYASGGVDYETIIELANVTRKDLWICVPHLASDDYIRRMARLCSSRLNIFSKLFVENSNEVWNPVFTQMRDNQAAARDDPTLTRTDDFGRQAQRAGKEIVRISNIFRQEYHPILFEWRVRPVLGAFIASDYWASSALSYIQNTYGDPKNFIHAIAIAPYVGNPGDMADIDNQDLSLDTLFAWMHNRIDTQIVPWIQQHKALADQYGIKLHSYEAGQHLQALDGTNEFLKELAQNDRRMGDVYKHLIYAWHQNSGGGIFGNFALATPPSRFGHWGLLTSIDQSGSVKWRAVMSTIAPEKYPF